MSDEHVNEGWRLRQKEEMAAKKQEADPEAEAKKETRTVFVGNLPITVQRKRLLQVRLLDPGGAHTATWHANNRMLTLGDAALHPVWQD